MLRTDSSDLINLFDDSVDQLFSNKPEKDIITSHDTTELDELILRLNPSRTADTILNEEITAQNLPASPPFTKVSAIKMYTKSSTPLRKIVIAKDVGTVEIMGLPATSVENVEITTVLPDPTVTITEYTRNPALLARKDHTRSFLPRIKKRQKQ